jgi:sulfur-oxidizing protein SoxZ
MGSVPRTHRVIMPEQARAGEIVRVRCLIQHPMITGHSATGANTQPRNIIRTLTVSYDSRQVFRADLMPGIAANPYTAFAFRATVTGYVEFVWIDDQGERTVATRRLTVAP